VELIYRKLLQALEADGVQVIQADGQLFDPNLHEAIQQEPSPEHQSGQIIEVLQKGYTISGRVLRPATVRIAQ
jgi:molecular chaperone GrpE